MFNIHELLKQLRRPKILVRAAKLALPEYNRDVDLRRITRMARTPTIAVALDKLLQQEDSLESARVSGKAAYDVHRHIQVLTAILAEARLPGMRARLSA